MFRYPARPDIPIFDGEFQLEGRAGQTIALVGPSGCGKSTTIGMLQRWYDPSFGNVRLDEHKTQSFSLHNLRSHMAVVSQEPVLFDMSIGDNIRFGLEEGVQATQEQLEQVAKSANIHQFIESLPDGYDTRVGEKVRKKKASLTDKNGIDTYHSNKTGFSIIWWSKAAYRHCASDDPEPSRALAGRSNVCTRQ